MDARTTIKSTTGTSTTTTEALALLQRGQTAAASALLERVIAADARNFDAWFLLGAVHHGRKMLDAAANAYEKVIALNPRHADAHYFLGNVRGERGDPEGAMRCYGAALEHRAGFRRGGSQSRRPVARLRAGPPMPWRVTCGFCSTAAARRTSS